MMVRILSILPLATGSVCILLVLIGAIGYTADSETVGIPIPPCAPGSDSVCEVGMNHDNLSIPQPFMLLDVKVTMAWDHPNDAWVAIVDAEQIDYDKCEPNDQGLTGCTLSDFTILAGGPESEGSLVWDLEPGSTRFITAGKAGTLTLDTNVVTYSYSVGLGLAPLLLLGAVGVVLCLSGVQMAFPIKFGKKGGSAGR